MGMDLTVSWGHPYRLTDLTPYSLNFRSFDTRDLDRFIIKERKLFYVNDLSVCLSVRAISSERFGISGRNLVGIFFGSIVRLSSEMGIRGQRAPELFQKIH